MGRWTPTFAVVAIVCLLYVFLIVFGVIPQG